MLHESLQACRRYGPHPRCDLAETAGPDSTTETTLVYTLLNQMWNHGWDGHQGAYQNDLTALRGSKFQADLVQ